jgi:hypothetical protein
MGRKSRAKATLSELAAERTKYSEMRSLLEDRYGDAKILEIQAILDLGAENEIPSEFQELAKQHAIVRELEENLVEERTRIVTQDKQFQSPRDRYNHWRDFQCTEEEQKLLSLSDWVKRELNNHIRNIQRRGWKNPSAEDKHTFQGLTVALESLTKDLATYTERHRLVSKQ